MKTCGDCPHWRLRTGQWLGAIFNVCDLCEYRSACRLPHVPPWCPLEDAPEEVNA